MPLRIRDLSLVACGAALLILPFAYALRAERGTADAAALGVLIDYLQASYARDYRRAYRLISTSDRRLKDERSYVLERGAFTGFTLEVAKQLASYLEVSPVEYRELSSRATVRVMLNLPDANKLAPMLFDWDTERLEALSGGERQAILRSLEQLRQERKLERIEGEQSFELVRETEGWKIFLDWAAGVKFRFQTTVPPAVPVEAKVLQSEVTTRPGETFAISLKITNTGREAVTARIGHLVEPHEFRDYLDLVECGFLLPIRLLPGKEEQFTSTYLLRSGLPEEARQLMVTYAVALQN
jgi:hypothetical protein